MERKDIIDRLADYLITGIVLIVIVFFTGVVIYNFRVVLNITLILLCIIFSGFIVYEGVTCFYKKITFNNKK